MLEIKAVLIALGVLNALPVGRTLNAVLDAAKAFEPLPTRIRLSALASAVIWLSVAACGRLIACF